MRKLWIAALLFVVVLPLSAQQSTQEAPDQNEPLPPCADLYKANLRVSKVEDATLSGAIFCRELVEDGEFVVNPGEIGNKRVLERGVLQAYNIFNIAMGSGSTDPFQHAITICLEGSGDFLFLPVFGSPRPIITARSYGKGDYTCAEIGSPGIVALVSE